MTASGWTNRCPRKPGAAHATQAALNNFARTVTRPPRILRLPLIFPLSRAIGATPTRALI
jgi:hypothetical protein